MRKAHKKQAEDFVTLLGQVHGEIKKAVEKKNISVALSLLADCQEGAISLGNLVEQTEEENAAIIPLLQKYCEVLYLLYEKLVGESSTIEIAKYGNKMYKQLRNYYIQLRNCVQEIKVRQEIVFLPYKAAMWDSLESVWKAVDEDPDCSAYVIPIPYYDRKADGSFGERHYEAAMYPGYVPITYYKDYDFEKRRPDKIYIHNPYDDCNYVTSVEPFFYSKNLKQYTEELVYIPYFILGEVDPKDEEAVERMQHFCTVPGVIYADKVIVQSENMRQVYIKVMTKFSAEQGYSKQYWEKKIVGLGSPKIDKVLNTKQEDLDIPEDWMRIIQKPDGSRKKVVFYNTSVVALLKHEQKMIEKMQDVFRIFLESRNEVALLWRPHPLIKATIESMRPQLWEKYKELIDRYKEEGWGIYDDSADVDRAIVLSDVYYGDESSIVQLCQKKEKPVMIQNVEILSGSWGKS